MALQIVLSVTQNSGCGSLTLRDTTGTYNLINNPGGWGAPNSTIASATAYSITFKNYLDLSSTTYDLSVSEFAELFALSGLTLSAEDVFGTGTTVFPDGYWQITYSVTTPAGTYTYINNQVFYCVVACCIRKASLTIKIPVENYKDVQKKFLMAMYFKNLQYAACCGNYNVFLENLIELQKLCEGCGTSNVEGTYAQQKGCGCS